MSWDECPQALQGFSILSILEIGAKQLAVLAAKTRENTTSLTREHKFLGGNQGNLCVEEFR